MSANEAKKTSTEGKTFIDLMEDALTPGSTVYQFLAKLNMKDAEENALYTELKGLGYGGISAPDFKRIFDLYRGNTKIRKAAGEAGY